MAGRVDIAEIILWGRSIGAIAWDESRQLGRFEYTADFAKSGIQPAPLMMPARSGEVYAFPGLGRETFQGLPGMLSDSLPDRFGNLLINRWLEGRGRKPESFSPVERLCYMGHRGMGALEFRPFLRRGEANSQALDVAALVQLANQALAGKKELRTHLKNRDAKAEAAALKEIIQVGTSAGGARAKAVIVWNRESDEIRSGQVDIPEGYEPWLIKFDGVTGNRDKELADPQGYGKIEFAYSLMAKEAGIEMSECRLLHENGRSHFMTRRFDRSNSGSKLHMQSLCAMAHYDFNMAGAYSYEQAFRIMQKLDLPRQSIEEQFRRTVLNVLARNQDDHTKNIAFLMNKRGEWRLSPAYDVTYSYNPDGAWTSRHQMSVNGKQDNFDLEDLLAIAKTVTIKKARAKSLIEQVRNAVEKWPAFAEKAGVSESWAGQIKKSFRTF